MAEALLGWGLSEGPAHTPGTTPGPFPLRAGPPGSGVAATRTLPEARMRRWTSGPWGVRQSVQATPVHGLVPRWGCWEWGPRTRGLSLLDKQLNAQPQDSSWSPVPAGDPRGWGAPRIESCVSLSLQHLARDWGVGRCAVAETTSYDKIMLASHKGGGKRGQRPQETPRRLLSAPAGGQPATARGTGPADTRAL